VHSYGESDDKIYGNIYGDQNSHMIMKKIFLLIKNYPTMPLKKKYFIGKYFQQSHLLLVRVRNNVDPLDPGSRTDSLSQDRFNPKEQ